MKHFIWIPLVLLASCSSTPAKTDFRKEDRAAIREDLVNKGKILKEYITGDNDLIIIHREGYFITKYRISDYAEPQVSEDGKKLPAQKRSASQALYAIDTNLKTCKSFSGTTASDIPCHKLKRDPDLSLHMKK